jgi:hypothetical protein
LLLALATFAALDTAIAATALRHFELARDAFIAQVGAGDQILQSLSEVRGDLTYDTALAATSGLTLGILGVAIRWPSRVARLITCCLAGFIAVGLIVGYGASPENVIPVDSAAPEQMRRAATNLLLSWYPACQSIVAALEILGLITVAVLLMSSTAGDYYRRVRVDERPARWSYQHGASE